MTLNREGNVYVADYKQQKVIIYTSQGRYISCIDAADTPDMTWLPLAVAVDDHGRVFVTDIANHCVHVFHEGRHIQQIGHRGSGEGYFEAPRDIAINSDGELLVCDLNHRVQVFEL